MFKSNNLRQRIVINADTAERIGCISDIEIDDLSGRISRLIVRRSGFFAGLFHIGEIMIPWDAITAAGSEFILVKSFDLGEKCLKKP